MCLKLNSVYSKVHIAKKDITVYKVLRKDKHHKYITYFQSFPIKIGKTYYSELTKAFYSKKSVEEGIHSFETIQGALSIPSGHIVECIIPKGSHYYIGSFGNHVSYASDTLHYVEIIENPYDYIYESRT